MNPEITVVEVDAGHAAVVRARVAMRDIPRGIMPLVDQVWQFVRAGGVPGHGHNIWIYRHREDGDVDVEVGVQVPAPFAERDGVVATRTPAGRAAHAVHFGDYGRLPAVHAAIHKWCGDNDRARAGVNWEVYGDMDEDPAKRRCDVYHLLK
jgi:effector-binding domain-containing protein